MRQRWEIRKNMNELAKIKIKRGRWKVERKTEDKK